VALLGLAVAIPVVCLAWPVADLVNKPKPWDLDAVVGGLWNETVLGRSAWMAIPLAAGAWALVARWRGLAERFVALGVLGVALAIVVQFMAFRWGKGYYLGQVSPFLVWIAAVGTAALARKAGAAASPRTAWPRLARWAPTLAGAGVAARSPCRRSPCRSGPASSPCRRSTRSWPAARSRC
jgi:multisubunit Na+/H+ antiporter MnhF subunit